MEVTEEESTSLQQIDEITIDEKFLDSIEEDRRKRIIAIIERNPKHLFKVSEPSKCTIPYKKNVLKKREAVKYDKNILLMVHNMYATRCDSSAFIKLINEIYPDLKIIMIADIINNADGIWLGRYIKDIPKRFNYVLTRLPTIVLIKKEIWDENRSDVDDQIFVLDGFIKDGYIEKNAILPTTESIEAWLNKIM